MQELAPDGMIHELLPRRRAWLHLVQGEATLGDVVAPRDGAGITADRAFARGAGESEILFLDVGD